jgi:hypothetical protein
MGAFEVQRSEATTVFSLSEGIVTGFGATMAAMTRAVASIDPMTTTVTLLNEPPGGRLDDGEMPLTWSIDAAVDSDLDLDLELCYTDEQLGDLVEAQLQIYRDAGSGWTNMGGVVNEANNCVTLDNVAELSDWTLATDLPVENSDFFVLLPLVNAP